MGFAKTLNPSYRSVRELKGAAAELDLERRAFGAGHPDAQDVAAGAVDREGAGPLALGVDLAHDVVARVDVDAAVGVEQPELEHLRRIGAAGKRYLRHQIARLQVGGEVIVGDLLLATGERAADDAVL